MSQEESNAIIWLSVKKKKLILLLGLLLLVVFFGGFFAASKQELKPNQPGLAKVIFCDVGQGDAAILMVGSFQFLVDAGPSETAVLGCLNRFLPRDDRELELVMATHGDSDHIKGFSAVFSAFSVKQMLLVSLTKKSADFEAFAQAVSREKEQGMIVTYINQGDRFTFVDDFYATVLSPRVEKQKRGEANISRSEAILSAQNQQNVDKYEWENNRSIALNVEIYGTSILLTGDIEKEGEEALAQAGLINKTTILKVAHHGSKTSSTKTFLDRARPEIAVISCGKNNSYHHPSQETIDELTKRRVRVLRTDQLSHVVMEISRAGRVKVLP